MSRTTTALDQLDAVRHELDQLTKTVLEEIERRGRYTTKPDGYPSRTLGDGTSAGANELTSAESIANRRAFPGTDDDYFGRCTVPTSEPDPTGDAIRQLFQAIGQAASIFDAIGDRRRYILNVHHAASRKIATGAGTCGCCQRDVPGTDTDRLRSGYCDACRKAWERAGRPDRLTFEIERRKTLDDGDTHQPTSEQESTTDRPQPDTLRANVGSVGR